MTSRQSRHPGDLLDATVCFSQSDGLIFTNLPFLFSPVRIFGRMQSTLSFGHVVRAGKNMNRLESQDSVEITQADCTVSRADVGRFRAVSISVLH